jgi:hypothetical protein
MNAAPFGFPNTRPAAGPKSEQRLSCGYALYRVQPIWPAADSLPFCSWKRVLQLLSWSLLPLRRFNPSESTPPRLTSPGTFRPQGFAPSRRITPRSDVWPCFMPVAPMGFFTLQGVSPTARGPLTRRQRTALLTFSRDSIAFSTEMETAPSSRRRHATSRKTRLQLLRLQGITPAADPFFIPGGLGLP